MSPPIRFVLTVCLGLGFSMAVLAGPPTFTVTNTNDAGPGSFRWAVGMSNDNPDDDNIINFSSETVGNPIVLESPVTITSPVSFIGNSISSTIIDGGDQTQILVIEDGVWFVVIQDLTMRNARNETGFGGGAITSGADFLTIVGVHFLDNRTNHQGGAVFHNPLITGSLLDIRNCLMRDNRVIGDADFNRGGAVHAVMFRPDDGVRIEECIITSNRARSGGGVSVEVVTTAFDEGQQTLINDSTITNNQATANGGGIYIDAWSPHILAVAGSEIRGNLASGDGGGIWARSSVVIFSSLLASNVAQTCAGGGHFQLDSPEGAPESWWVLNSTISSNVAGNTDAPCAAGLRFEATESGLEPVNFQIAHSTVVFNDGEYEGAFGASALGIENRTDWEAMIENTIVVANGTGASGMATGGPPRDVHGRFNLVWSLLGTQSAASVLVENDGLQRIADPGLQPLADNGGRTMTHKLTLDSPARNNGNPDFTGPPEMDQRRDPDFPRIANGRVDIGAFESQLDILFRASFRDFRLSQDDYTHD